MHKFDPRESERLLSAERFISLQPEKLLRDAGLKEGAVFADIGCGPGFFTLPASLITGEDGKVYAIDTQDEMLAALRRRNPPKNVIVLKSEENSIPLKDKESDFTFLSSVLHEASEKLKFLSELKRITRKDGTLAVIEWKKVREDKGPPFEERISGEDSVLLLKEAGFRDIVLTSLNDSQYMITAKP